MSEVDAKKKNNRLENIVGAVVIVVACAGVYIKAQIQKWGRDISTISSVGDAEDLLDDYMDGTYAVRVKDRWTDDYRWVKFDDGILYSTGIGADFTQQAHKLKRTNPNLTSGLNCIGAEVHGPGHDGYDGEYLCYSTEARSLPVQTPKGRGSSFDVAPGKLFYRSGTGWSIDPYYADVYSK